MSADSSHVLDALVVGGGPGGLSAATWLGRYQRTTAVVDAGHQRNLPAASAHGLLGRDPTTPHQLLADARAGLDQYPHVTLHHGSVTDLRRDDDGLFRANVGDVELCAQRVILATGVTDHFPQIAGFHDHYGIDVHHCPACEGFTIRDQTVIVVGSGEQVPAYASEMLDWARTVRIISGSDTDALTDQQLLALNDHAIEVVDGIAEALVGEPGSLTGVRLQDGRLVEGDVVFFSYGHQPVNELARQLGCDIDDEGRISVNPFQLTSVDGVYAVGDVTPGLQLISIAIGKGTAAGIACATSLRGHSTENPAVDPAPPTSRFAVE